MENLGRSSQQIVVNSENFIIGSEISQNAVFHLPAGIKHPESSIMNIQFLSNSISDYS
jgi:hypothetical protein